MKMKLVLSLSSIAVILLVTSFISIMEYSRMSTYVSNLIAANIGSINAAQKLADAANSYNLGILAVIGVAPNQRNKNFWTFAQLKGLDNQAF